LPYGSHGRSNSTCSLDDVFQKELVLTSSPEKKRVLKRPQPMVAIVAPDEDYPSGTPCHFVWKERQRPMAPVAGSEVPVTPAACNTPAALQFIRKTPVGRGISAMSSPHVSPAGDGPSAPSPQMRSLRRQGSTGLLLEEDEDWDERKVVPARNLWLKARDLLRQAGLNPRQVTLGCPSTAENAQECSVSTKVQRVKSESLMTVALREATSTPKQEKVGKASLLTELKSRTEDGDKDHSDPSDALGKLLDEHRQSQLESTSKALACARAREAEDRFVGRMKARSSSQGTLESPKAEAKLVYRSRMAALGAANLWRAKVRTV
jgi:hypothetical protein